MEKIDYNSVKRKIEKERCNIHNSSPKFEKTSKGFNITACCEEFRSKAIKKSEVIVREETKLALQKMLKNAFR